MTTGLSLRRIGAAAVLMAVGATLVALGFWGTWWTVSRAGSPDARYSLLTTWNAAGAPAGRLERPIGIAVAPSGDVYITDARQRVLQFDSRGEFHGQWGRPGNGRGEFSNPVGVAVGPNGSVYVTDYEQDRIQKFTPTGRFLEAFGSSGSEPGQFSAPAGLAVDAAGALYVADFYNHRVQKFRADGSFERIIGRPGRLGPGALHYPTAVAITATGQVLVADAYNYQLQWFDRDSQPLSRVGYHLFWLWPRPVSSASGFNVPTGAAVSTTGVVHVADSGNHRVVMLSERGEYLTEWKVPDATPGVYSPEHIAVSPDGWTVYATDLAVGRVLVLKVERRAQ